MSSWLFFFFPLRFNFMLPSSSTAIILFVTVVVSFPMDERSQLPIPRWATDCVLNAAVLYCYGGITERYYDDNQLYYDEIPTNTMYRLALYESWSIDNPAWEEIESDAAPLGYFASANLPGTNGFLIHGGQGEHMKITRSTLVYDIDTNEWSEPSLQGQLPVQRIRHSATSDNQGRVWIWGGKSDLFSNTVLYDNRWTVIDTSTWAYSYPDISNPPFPRVDHTATLIPDGKIIIIGGLVFSRNVTDPSGQYSLNPVSMSSLLKFDAAGSQWLNVTATGNIPAPRGGHSAVLSSDGSSIIVFGGGTIGDDEGEFKTLNDIFVLELATMRWSAPSITGELPLPRKYHYARLVDENTMLVGFGLGSDEQGLNGISLLSTSTWSWILEYQPNLAWLTGNATFVPNTSQVPELPTSLSPSNVTSSDNSTMLQPHSSNQSVQAAAGQNPMNDPNESGTQGHQSHVRAGVIAGVVSGGVVAIIGGIFLVLSVVFIRHRRIVSQKERNRDDSSLDHITLTELTGQKPNCPSSLYNVHPTSDQRLKPDERDS